MRYPGRKVMVVGLGITGLKSCEFLKRHGYVVSAYDENRTPEVEKNVKRLEAACGIKTSFDLTEEALQIDWIVISPGVSPFSKCYQILLKTGKRIFSEIEVASWYNRSQNVIGVTGTCGKTTVVTLLRDTIKEWGKRVYLCGNIGAPWIEIVDQVKQQDYVVLELSSFQLFHCFYFSPDLAVLLNISPNHEDWHGSQEHYVESKLRLFSHLTDRGAAFFNEKDRKKYFGKLGFAHEVAIHSDAPNNNVNYQFVRAVASYLSIPEEKVDKILKAFTGLEHRLELVEIIDGVKFVNDSKSTTVASLGWALEQMREKKVVLIAGGIAKSSDFDTLRALVKTKVKCVVLLGRDAPILAKSWEGCAEIIITVNLEEALKAALQMAAREDTVLLSPACASFDMFKNYIERGQVYKRLVRELVKNNASKASSV